METPTNSSQPTDKKCDGQTLQAATVLFARLEKTVREFSNVGLL